MLPSNFGRAIATGMARVSHESRSRLASPVKQIRPHGGEPVVHTLVVHQHPDADGTVGAVHRFGLDAERARLAARDEHHLSRNTLEAFGSCEYGGRVDGGGF